MYRILLVDDEAYFREYLRKCIPWAQYGFELCGEAGSGEEALEMLEKMPDIILADIHMVCMNGLEFTKKAKKILPDVQIIIITGYSEFEYAKQAINLGVCNFITKPFEKQELIDSLLKTKESINCNHKHKDLINTLQKEFEDTVPMARDTVLYRVLSGEYLPDNLHKMELDLKRVKIKLPPYPSVVVQIENHLYSESGGKRSPASIEEINLIAFTHTVVNSVFFHHEDRVIGILGIMEGSTLERLSIDLQGRINRLIAMFQGTVSIGIGTIVNSIEELSDSYEKAGIALHNKFLLGNNHAISYSALKVMGKGDELYPFELKNDLLMYARLLDWEKVHQTIDDIYNNIRKRSISIDFVYILYTELLSNCFSCLAEYDKKMEVVYGDDFRPFDKLLSCNSIHEIHEYVLSVYKRGISYLLERKQASSLDTVRKIKEYIDYNYKRSNLTIDEIAANVFFHPSYVRFLFKNEMGVTINEYLTQVRMEKAKKLLLKGIYQHMDVAAMVGYTDAAYFSKCFKKYYKINPRDFEKILSS